MLGRCSVRSLKERYSVFQSNELEVPIEETANAEVKSLSLSPTDDFDEEYSFGSPLRAKVLLLLFVIGSNGGCALAMYSPINHSHTIE